MLNKDKNILIIDEVFDYLDDANLICAQYYISKFINEYKNNNKDIYPIILTYLDPLYFQNYTFKERKLYYLKEQNDYKPDELLKLLANRSNSIIKDNVSKYFLHYNNKDYDLASEFKELGIYESINTVYKLREKAYKELDKYIDRNKYKPLMTFLDIRLKIEENIFNLIKDKDKQNEFIDTFKTKNKLDFAKDNGVEIPEVYYLLVIIYNDSMHIGKDTQNAIRMSYKLDNEIIRSIISKI